MLTVNDASTRFLDALRARQAPANTIKAYASDLRQFTAIAPDDLDAVDTPSVQAFLQGTHQDTQHAQPAQPAQQCSPATQRRRHATLSAFYAWLLRQELIATSPMGRVDPAELPLRLPRPLAADTVKAILEAIPPAATRDRTLFTLLYETGMRVGEAISLHFADIDLTSDDEKIRVLGKGQRERMVLLTAAPESIRLLRRHLRLSGIKSGAVFRGDARYGGSNLPVDYTTVLRAWQRYCQQVDVQATIHQLRHSRASQLVQAGVPLGTVRKLLGHRNIQSTLLYADVDPQTVKRDLLEYQRRTRKQGKNR